MSSVVYKNKVIPTGSIALFASAGCVGGCIRCAQKEKNPLGISHVGIVVVESPYNVYDTLTTSPHLTDTQREYAQKQIINRRSQKPEIFVLEATGSVAQVLQTGYPFVTISQFSRLEEMYDGNIYLRPCLTPVEFNWEQYLGISYEREFLELIKSTRRKNYRSSREQVFCSELVAWILNQAGWYKNCPANCTPAELGAWNKLENYADFQIY